MRIGSLGYTPFIYNTNMLSGSSLSKVSPIGEDLTSKKTDFSSLTDASFNINPLGKGETANFFDILGMQMQMSRMNASRLMVDEGIQATAPDTEIMQGAEVAEEIEEAGQTAAETLEVNEATPEELAADVASLADSAMDAAEMVEDFRPVDQMEEVLSMQFDRNLYQMQRAAEAYRVQML